VGKLVGNDGGHSEFFGGGGLQGVVEEVGGPESHNTPIFHCSGEVTTIMRGGGRMKGGKRRKGVSAVEDFKGL
jgi:hypothetical protein